jgi:hypothetical protein
MRNDRSYASSAMSIHDMCTIMEPKLYDSVELRDFSQYTNLISPTPL